MGATPRSRRRFVGNACTFAFLDEPSGPAAEARLRLEVSLRHGDSRATCAFTYRRPAAAAADWELAGVGVGRECLGRLPGPGEDEIFAGPAGVIGAAERGLSGPADRVSTELLPAAEEGDVSLGVEGRLALSGPRRLAEGEEHPRNKEIVLEWSTPSVPVTPPSRPRPPPAPALASSTRYGQARPRAHAARAGCRRPPLPPPPPAVRACGRAGRQEGRRGLREIVGGGDGAEISAPCCAHRAGS